MSPSNRILVVDDDDSLRRAATKVLSADGYRAEGAAGGAEALSRMRQEKFDLILADLRLPDLDGLELLRRAKELRASTEVVMISGQGSIGLAVEAMRLGAYDFVEKPIDSVALMKTVAKALEKRGLAEENRRLRRQLRRRRGEEALIGDSPAMQQVRRLIRQIAGTDVAVLIQGASGTGKEVVADAIHELSEHRGKPFVKLSCAAIPENLLESELFGHRRGAFTGATADKPGRFEMAHGGTLLLDEIAEMSPALQAKLLRVIQDGWYQPLGSTRDFHADVRLLSATHADIPRAIAEGKFRQDLYYRINTVTVVLPPLCARREDIPNLAAHFLQRFCVEIGKEVRTLTPAAMAQLMAHPWPGNVRELEHVIERAVALAQSDKIDHVETAPSAATYPADAEVVGIPVGTTVDAATHRLVEATLQKCGGNKIRAARILGIPPRTMYRHYSRNSD